MAGRMRVRAARLEDKPAVLAIHENVYKGRDYLQDYFDYFLAHPYTLAVVGELDGKVIAFLAGTVVDGGQTMVARSGRVRPELESQGFYRQLTEAMKDHLRQYSDIARLAYTAYRRYDPAQLFGRHTHIYDMDSSEEGLRAHIRVIMRRRSRSQEAITILGRSDILRLLKNQDNPYLFPRRRMIVDRVPFRLQPENADFVFGRNTIFLSDVDANSGITHGLLSACSFFRSRSPTYSAMIDIFGSRLDTLNEHLAFYFMNICSLTKGLVSIEITTDQNVSRYTLDTELAKFGKAGLHYRESMNLGVMESKL